jgi:hypothetical protein
MKSALFARTDNDRVVVDPWAGIFAAIAAARVTIAPIAIPIERSKCAFLLLSGAYGGSETDPHSDFRSTHAFHARV